MLPSWYSEEEMKSTTSWKGLVQSITGNGRFRDWANTGLWHLRLQPLLPLRKRKMERVQGAVFLSVWEEGGDPGLWHGAHCAAVWGCAPSTGLLGAPVWVWPLSCHAPQLPLPWEGFFEMGLLLSREESASCQLQSSTAALHGDSHRGISIQTKPECHRVNIAYFMLNHILKQVWIVGIQWEMHISGIEMGFDQGAILAMPLPVSLPSLGGSGHSVTNSGRWRGRHGGWAGWRDTSHTGTANVESNVGLGAHKKVSFWLCIKY